MNRMESRYLQVFASFSHSPLDRSMLISSCMPRDCISMGKSILISWGSAAIALTTIAMSQGREVGNLSFALFAVSEERSWNNSRTVWVTRIALISFREFTSFCWYLLFSSNRETIVSNFWSESFQSFVIKSESAVKSYLQPLFSVSVFPSARALIASMIWSSLPSFASM